MNIPQIRMESQFARISIEQTKPVQEIEQPPASVAIEQPPANLEIEQIPGKLTIDQSQAWEEMDLKSVFKRSAEYAQQGYQAWLDGMVRVSQQGDELMRIEHGGDPLVSQAIENSENPPYEFNVGWIPSPFSVKIDYEPGTVNIRAQANKPIIEATPNKPIHRYTPGKVNIYLAQRNELSIQFVNTKA